MGKERKYTDREVASVLFLCDANAAANKSGRPNFSHIARETGIPRRTVSQWYHRQIRRNRDTASLRHNKKTDLAQRLDGLCAEILDSVDAAKLEDASLQQLLTSMGIAIDKARLLRGESTSISETHHFDGDEARLDLAKRFDRLRSSRRAAEHN